MMGAVMNRASSRGLDYKLWLFDSSLPPESHGRPTWFGPLMPIDIQHAFGFAQISRKRGSEVVAVGEGPDAAEVVEMFAEEAEKRESETGVRSMGEAFMQAVRDNQGEEAARQLEEGLEAMRNAFKVLGDAASNESVDKQLRAWGMEETADLLKKQPPPKPKPPQDRSDFAREWKPKLSNPWQEPPWQNTTWKRGRR